MTVKVDYQVIGEYIYKINFQIEQNLCVRQCVRAYERGTETKRVDPQ